jgi:hypothetical protein
MLKVIILIAFISLTSNYVIKRNDITEVLDSPCQLTVNYDSSSSTTFQITNLKLLNCNKYASIYWANPKKQIMYIDFYANKNATLPFRLTIDKFNNYDDVKLYHISNGIQLITNSTKYLDSEPGTNKVTIKVVGPEIKRYYGVEIYFQIESK